MPTYYVHRVDTPLVQEILTKGDNNEYDDISLYKRMKWLERRHIVGKVRGFLPYVGYVTIAMVSITVLHFLQLVFTNPLRTTFPK
jgi:signal peptidase I